MLKTSLSKISINLKSLNDDFELPLDDSWERDRVVGQGAYGKVMECTHKQTGYSFAIKRFEDIFRDN